MMRPAPMFKCPTSEFPIWPAGSPTAIPDASSVVHGDSRKSRSNRGVFACAIALNSRSLRQPNPSMTTRIRKGRLATLRRSLLPLEHHADVIGRAGFEVERSDADQLPTVVAEAVELFSATGIHRVVLRPDVDDLIFPGLHVRPPVVLNGLGKSVAPT